MTKVKVKLFGHFRYITNSKEEDVDIKGKTVKDVVSALVDKYPDLGPAILDNKEIRPYVNLLLNGKNVRESGGLKAAVKDGDDITLFPPMAGG